MRKTITAILSLLLIFIFALPVFANLPGLPANLAVHDSANVLSAGTINYLANRNEDLFYYTGGEVMFLTMDFIPMGRDIADFAMDVFNYWEIGSAERDNGVLVVMSIGEDYFWVVSGFGLEAAMSRATLDTLIAEYFTPHFDAGNFDVAVINLFDVLAERIYLLFPPVMQSAPAPGPPGDGARDAARPRRDARHCHAVAGISCGTGGGLSPAPSCASGGRSGAPLPIPCRS